MFDIFRKHTKIMMILLFLLIIPSFVLFGIDGYNSMGQSDPVVAKVGAIEITQTQWDSAHKNQVDRLRAGQPDIDIKLFDSAEARFATLQRLIRETVMRVAAEKFGLFTSDARLARFLQEDPTIASLRQADGKLDMERYRQLAASQGLTPEGFENTVRQDISRQQVEAALLQSGFVTTAPADVALNAFFEQREIQVAAFMADDYAAGISPSDADLEVFYQANQAMFQAPEQADIEYVVLDMASVKKDIQINEADLRAYYDQNADRLSGNEERRASHILISVPATASADDRQQAREKAEKLLLSVRANPDGFADLARKHSQDPGSAERGGDLDFFARGVMLKPFEEAVFAMQKGTVSDVVTSDFGYHIIKLTDIKTPKRPSFDDLRATLENDLKTQQAQRKFAEVAELFTNTVYEQADSLGPVAEKLGLKIQKADKVVRQPTANNSGVLAKEQFLAAIFSSDSINNKRNTEAVETAPNELAAGRIVAYSPARTQALDEVRDLVRQRVIAARAAELADKAGSEKLALWKKEPVQAALSREFVVSREQGGGSPPEVVLAAMKADATTLPTWQGVDLGAAGYIVLRVNKVLPRPAPAESAIKQHRQQYTNGWTAAEAEAYLDSLKERFKVEILVPTPLANATAQRGL